jgi:hypothetical protein
MVGSNMTRIHSLELEVANDLQFVKPKTMIDQLIALVK